MYIMYSYTHIWKMGHCADIQILLLTQVPQHNQAVLSQGRWCGGDVWCYSGGELQGCVALAHQCSGWTFDPFSPVQVLFCCMHGSVRPILEFTFLKAGVIAHNVYAVHIFGKSWNGKLWNTVLYFLRKQQEKGSLFSC